MDSKDKKITVCCKNSIYFLGFYLINFIFFRKIDFVLVYEEDKKDSIDNPGFMFDVENQEGAVNNGGAPTPSPTHHR